VVKELEERTISTTDDTDFTDRVEDSSLIEPLNFLNPEPRTLRPEYLQYIDSDHNMLKYFIDT
jgi:hypothetical protein